MYAWIWRHLPGDLRTRAAVAAGLVLVAGLVLWYGFFPWLEERVRFDQGVIQPGPAGSPSPGGSSLPGPGRG